jgi:hypothetical protein
MSNQLVEQYVKLSTRFEQAMPTAGKAYTQLNVDANCI